MSGQEDKAGRQQVIALIGKIDVALLTTTAEDGLEFRARPMAYRHVEDGGDIWFFTKRDSKKIAEVQASARVLVTFSEPTKGVFVTLGGTAEVIDDRARVKTLWSEVYRIWFPGGAEDGNVVLLRVVSTRAEYWDTPTNKMIYAFGYVRARATGKPLRAGEIGVVDSM